MLSNASQALRDNKPGVVFAVICAAGIGGLLGIGATREALNELSEQQAGLRRALTRANSVSAEPVSTLALPGAETLPAISATIPTLLQRYEVTLIDAAFSPTKDHDRVARSAQVVLRLRGTYGNVRSALAALLANHDGVALQALSFRRAKSIDMTLDAEVRLEIYYREHQ